MPEVPSEDADANVEASQHQETNDDIDAPIRSRRSSQHKPTINTQKETSNISDSARSPSESGSPTHKMKEWLKSRFSRPRGRSAAGETSPEERGFIGGVALTRIANESSTSLDARSASMREVAIAGTSGTRSRAETSTSLPAGRGDFGGRALDSKNVSPVTSDDESETFVLARDDLEDPVSPPPTGKISASLKSTSPTRDSRFREII